MRKGFTLIEMLVVMAVFLTLMLVVSDVFLSVSVSQRRIAAESQALMDTQFNLEHIAQKARLNEIDYAAMAAEPPADNLKLILKTEAGGQIIFYRQTTGCPIEGAGCLIMENNGFKKVISANNVDITKFDFTLTPAESPYVFDDVKKQYLSGDQPLVLLLLQGTVKAAHAEDRKNIALQTTVSSRYYAR
jgi:prepilin-type N-terminal cleavage/methylation domain-containing protein